MSRIIIFDTTLRDGEQSPGATMTSPEKLRVATALTRLGVDVIEAGFAASSPDDTRSIQRIAEELGAGVITGRKNPKPPEICSLARAIRGDIDAAWNAVKAAARPRIHLFLGTSPIHREYKLRMDRAAVLKKTREMVAYAAEYDAHIQFSAEDAGRTEPEFLYEVLEVALEAGANTLNVPDTVGYIQPEEFMELVSGVFRHVRGVGADGVFVSVHCHNDLGLATANTLAGLRGGARQAEVTINGIGERAGNTALEEVVMGLDTRREYFQSEHGGFEHGITTELLASTSRMVSRVSGMPVQPNKAIVGRNAFSHEAGIHQDGILKEQSTYEIMRPETVGVAESALVMGKHSGRHALSVRLEELGHKVPEERLAKVFVRFKDLADKKKYLTDHDLVALLGSNSGEEQQLYTLDDLQVTCGTRGMATATLTLRDPEGRPETQAAVGAGPVDAAFNAIDTIMCTGSELMRYRLEAVTEGNDALGDASVQLRTADEGTDNLQTGDARRPIYRGQGADQDVIVASARAYLAASNRILRARAKVSGGEVAEAAKKTAEKTA
ncbi:MAG: 2-isopropylmalate synthase [Deltaproteobacteria bacterium]|nr:2-isopropylmalate synthase [Deltaproteobacteria bacterium]